MSLKVKIKDGAQRTILILDTEEEESLFLKDYLDFFRKALHAAGFAYVHDLAALTQFNVETAVESKELWRRKLGVEEELMKAGRAMRDSFEPIDNDDGTS